MPLLALPNELLFRIAEQISKEKELNSLAQTSHILHHIAKPVLYHAVEQHYSAPRKEGNRARFDDAYSMEWMSMSGTTRCATEMLLLILNSAGRTPKSRRRWSMLRSETGKIA
ncbi:hypothetical protein BJX99DRAFT_237106 [Aspergillus californicus]